jgi:hypothetical protein
MSSREGVRLAPFGRHDLDTSITGKAFGAFSDNLQTLSVAPQAAPGDKIFADFDDLGSDSGNLSEYYQFAGLHWLNWGWIDGKYAKSQIGDSGFTEGKVTGNAVAYNAYGDPASIASDGGNFDLTSVFLTAATRLNLEIHIQAYDDGVLKYDRTVVVDDDGPTKFKLDMTGIDAVTFTSSGGDNDPNIDDREDGNLFVADHFTFTAKDGSVSGRVFNDLNGDGEMEKGETGLAGRTVYLDTNHNGVMEDYEQSAVTDAKGKYAIAGVSFGQYDVRQVLGEGETQTTPIDPNNGYVFGDEAFSWVKINQDENKLTFDNRDDGQVTVNLSHALTLYGESYDTIYVSTNGLIALSPEFASTGGNLSLPDNNNPHGAIAPFWDDLNLGDKGQVYVFDDTEHSRFIVEWKDVALFSDASKLQTFEVILNYDGTMVFQYKDLDDGGSSATVGLEAKNETIGLQYSYDTASLHNGQAISFVPGTQPIPDHVTVDSGENSGHVDFGVQAAQAAELVV